MPSESVNNFILLFFVWEKKITKIVILEQWGISKCSIIGWFLLETGDNRNQ